MKLQSGKLVPTPPLEIHCVLSFCLCTCIALSLGSFKYAGHMCDRNLLQLNYLYDLFIDFVCVGCPSNFLLLFLQLEVWTKEREAAGLKASVNTLMSEIQRLNKLCAERKEAEDSLRKKWKKIEEFDARRSELESIYSALLKASMV